MIFGKGFSFFFFVAITVLILSACSSTDTARSSLSHSGKTVKHVPEAETAPKLDVYLIGPDDALAVNVWRNAELSLSVLVRPDGKITMPLIGDVQAANQSPPQLAEMITKKLTNFIRNPQVTVIVTAPKNADYERRVRITGAVGGPISVPYRRDMTVLDLVLEAGGLNEFASGNRSKLYRRVNGKMQAYPIRLKDMLQKGELKTNYKLAPADVITVPERFF